MLVADRGISQVKSILFESIPQNEKKGQLEVERKSKLSQRGTANLDDNNSDAIDEILKYIGASETMKKFKNGAKEFLLALCYLGKYKTTKGRRKKSILLEKYKNSKSNHFPEWVLKVKVQLCVLK